MNVLAMEKFCSCLELWKGCILAGIFSMSTSIFDLLWSVAHMVDEDNVFFFYLLFSLGIESVIFIMATGFLFIALVKRSKCLLLPWMVMAFIDVFFSLMVAFAELALSLQSTSCSVPVVSTVVTFLVCIMLIYCWLCVYAQYLYYASSSRTAQIKVTPMMNNISNNKMLVDRTIQSENQKSHSSSPERNSIDSLKSMLKVPDATPPKDAW